MTQPPLRHTHGSIEQKYVTMHRGACLCGWRGEWTEDKQDAQAEQNKHYLEKMTERNKEMEK